MRVIVVTRAHQFVIEVGLQEPVLEIKRKIEQLFGVPVASQTLSVLGWELMDGLDMEDYPIVTEGTKIDLTIKSLLLLPPLNHCSRIQIVLKFSARQFNIEVDATETVRSLKEKIHIMDGTPLKRMSLFYSGMELEDFRNLNEYGVREFSEIVVFLKSMQNRMSDEPPSARLSLLVQTSSSLLNAARIPLEMIKDSCTVNELRQILLSREILPIDDYLFIHKQRIMRDNCSLRWHGVENGDCLYVFKGTVSQSGSC
ncbi:uncharacterized protein LOC121253368 [Juglans microcarpa x Juglans regia]|uniref:uncharacterized protein LOC121253368 n=1 Tax=Juglans microcarpa x Juglans regia TaxID=2249226 RepID=UPI001B7E17C9|nr:uncharacterized protein LOC121253368 [Juglans microcarpa x Juglans regia]